ncbi:hypothetical protein JCM16303_006600 [Sporobolomyces ruberrimus]
MTSIGRALLPPEIINEILRSKELGDEDLASCCLVSKVFLDPAHHSLYDTVSVCIITDQVPGEQSEEEDDLAQEHPYHLQTSSGQILRTLLCNGALGQLVSTIEFNDIGYDAPEPEYSIIWMRPSDALATFARLCPRATGLEIFESSWDPESWKVTMRSKFRGIGRNPAPRNHKFSLEGSSTVQTSQKVNESKDYAHPATRPCTFPDAPSHRVLRVIV